MQLRLEADAMFIQIENQLRDGIAQYLWVTQTVDTVATVANIFASVGQIAYKGMKTLALSGTLLEKANRELTHDALKLAYQPPAELVGEQWSHRIYSDDRMAIAFAKAFLQSYFDLSTPSFWASVYTNVRAGKSWQDSVTTTPLDDLSRALANVRQKHRATLSAIDAQIRKLQSER